MLTPKFAQATQTVPPTSSSAVLDDGCGLGIVTVEVKKSFSDVHVLATDFSAGMLEAVNRKAERHGWKNVETKLLDGGDLTGTNILHDSFSTCTAPRPTVHLAQRMAHLNSQAQHTHFLRPNQARR